MTDGWDTFATLVGGASAALTGLLFVAVSLNLKQIATTPLLREAAARTLIVLMAPLLITTFISIPGQSDWILGLELLATGLLTLAVSRVVRVRPKSEDEHRAARFYWNLPPILITTMLLLAAGLSLILGYGGGLYWIIPAVFAAFLLGVTDAWLLTVRLAHEAAR